MDSKTVDTDLLLVRAGLGKFTLKSIHSKLRASAIEYTDYRKGLFDILRINDEMNYISLILKV